MYDEWLCPFLYAYPLQTLPSAEVGFQAWGGGGGGSGYSGVGWCLDRVRSCIGHSSTVHWFRTAVLSQDVSTAVFDDCWPILLGRQSRCFLTSLPSLYSCTAPKSTLPLLPSSSCWLLCSLFCTVVPLQCLCTSVVSAAVSVHTDPEAHLWPKAESSFSVSHSQGPLQLLRIAVLSDFERVSTLMQRAANFPPT